MSYDSTEAGPALRRYGLRVFIYPLVLMGLLAMTASNFDSTELETLKTFWIFTVGLETYFFITTRVHVKKKDANGHQG